MPLLSIRAGDTLTMKKKHPCGGFDWTVTRLGADIGLACTTCGRKILLERAKLEPRVKAIRHATNAKTAP
jgi:hypothetical protein